MLSPTIEVLIYLEHNGEVSAEKLKQWKKASLKGIIGKLEAQSLIMRTKSGGEVVYKLSDRGLDYLDAFLEKLHETSPQSNNWSVVLFSIPEKRRPSRDRFRRFLRKQGYGNIFGSAWIAPAKSGDAQLITEEAKRLKIENSVYVIEGKSQLDNDKEIVNMIWDIKSISQEYSSYVKRNQPKLKTLRKNSPEAAYEAKKIIFELATIMQDDPNLPTALLPATWPKTEAINLYKEVRKKIS